MEKMTIKAYAIKHKLSIFNVMKMAKSGKLKTESVEKNGKEVTYILIDEKREEEISEGIVPADEKPEALLRAEVKLLKEEVAALRKEIEAIKKKL